MSCNRLFLPVAVFLVGMSAAASPSDVRRLHHDKPLSFKKFQTSLNMKANFVGGMNNIIANDQARLHGFAGHNSATPGNNPTTSSVPVPVIDSGFLVVTDVQVGTPPTSYQLIVDTGSSNTFVGAHNPYVPTTSSHDTGEAVAVSYGSGSFSGEEFLDDVTVGSATITSQSIGVANRSQGFNGFDGILGLGPDGLTQGTLGNNPLVTIPTVTDNLANQGQAASALVGVSIPLTIAGPGSAGGSLDFGSPDPTKFTGSLTFVPVTTTPPANNFWGIDQSITYGDQKIPILNTTSGIVDTGTTLLYIATEAFKAYAAATNTTLDPATGLLMVNDASTLQSLFFQMGQNTLEFTANAQIFPRSLNAQIGGNSNSTYLIMQDIGTQSGRGLDFINGFTFLQRYYSVFDTLNAQVGFATTPQTNAISN